MVLHRPVRVPSVAALSALESALASFRIYAPNGLRQARLEGGRRHASHQSQGRANGAKDGPGKRLGAKKTSGEYVVPGNILYKQRGTLWFPGDGCHMVRSSTHQLSSLRSANCICHTGQRSHNPRLSPRLRDILSRSGSQSEAKVHRHSLQPQLDPATTCERTTAKTAWYARLPNADHDLRRIGR